MKILNNTPLAEYTSLRVGGNAETLQMFESSNEVQTQLEAGARPSWIMGYGSNSLVSDRGLPNLTWMLHGGDLNIDNTLLIADAGCWWDDLVVAAIDHGLWGVETMSGIPGGVGAAVVGNIAAYGQAVADTLSWIDVFDPNLNTVLRLYAKDLELDYRYSILQAPMYAHYIVLRAAFTLSLVTRNDIKYQSLLDVADAQGLDMNSLFDRRQATLQTRAAADSLYEYTHPDDYPKTAGSFFRNPEVNYQTARLVMRFDETGKSLERLEAMNRVHSGSGHRVSAAHVLLAAGYHRGQRWGEVQLNQDHILKIENTGSASAQDIYNVSQEIIRTVEQRLSITLQPEVRFLGEFDHET